VRVKCIAELVLSLDKIGKQCFDAVDFFIREWLRVKNGFYAIQELECTAGRYSRMRYRIKKGCPTTRGADQANRGPKSKLVSVL